MTIFWWQTSYGNSESYPSKCNGFIGAIGFDVLQYMFMHFATKFLVGNT
jgi:hypothetical protein